MTEASTGLRKALARNAGVSKMSPEELLAQMSDEQKTALAASLAPAPAPAASASEDGDEDDLENMEDGKKKPKSKKKDDEYMDENAKAKAASDRAIAVLTHEHAQGRMDVATGLLANDKLSADEIITVLAAMAPTEKPDPEAAARDEMKSALAANANSKIEANDGGVSKPEAKSADVWAAAHAKVFGTNKTA